jgi:hypothetical protein
MKNLCIICAALALVAGFAVSASAADLNSVPTATLTSMGFGGVELLSDNDGLAVRGKGTSASVWGVSGAIYHDRNGGAAAANGYQASSSHRRGSSLAVGGSESYAGKQTTHGRHGSSVTYGAGGGAFGYAR